MKITNMEWLSGNEVAVNITLDSGTKLAGLLDVIENRMKVEE